MKKFFFSFFFLFILFNQSYANTIHAIIVADTVHDIHSVTKPDLSRWKKELRMISKYSNMQLQEKIFTGADFNLEKIKNFLTTLSVQENDIIIFYFTGHGYRTYQKSSPWPFLIFEFYKPGLDIQWIAETIRNKKNRFALVISDCCNNFMEDGLFTHEKKNIQINLKPVSTHFWNYPKLFLQAKGCVVISSCSQGQFSWGSPYGGLYTQCFFTSLNHELREEAPSWKKLLDRAHQFIQHVQTPICEIYY